MSAFLKPKPKRQVPEPVAPPQHGAPNPMFSTSNDLHDFRWRILGITVGILAITALGYAVYGPWFEVRNISVSGTRLITPVSLQQVAETELDHWRWGIIPQRNLWLLSRNHLSQVLQAKIGQRISIEQVNIIKKNRHDLEIAVIERTPLALWKTTQAQGSIDRNGVIISTIPEAATLPTIIDQGNKPWAVDQQVLTKPVMDAFTILHNAFTMANMSVVEYRIPVPTCPSVVVEPTDLNTNQVTNTSPTNDNLNSSNLNLTNNDNSNVAVNNNLNTEPQVVVSDCDLAALAKASQEIHVKLKDGPLVLFDRHQDLALAVQTVKRLLADSSNSGASYIDIRFQERVYIK